MNSIRKLVTIVIPVYNEEANLGDVFRRVSQVMSSSSSYDFEVVMIDNGSTDQSRLRCLEFTQKDPRWKYVRFTRNFGIETSFFAGANYASGDALIYLFSDLQDPPEAIPQMLSKWAEGNDVVYGVLTKRSDQNIFKTWGASIAYRLIFLLSDVEIPINATDFRLLSRPVIDTLKTCKERVRYMRGLSHWTGFRQASFEFERALRKHGKSNATLWWCIKYAVSAMVSFSNKPLRLASVVGVATTIMSLLGGLGYIGLTLLTRGGYSSITPPPPGWTTIVLLIFFFGGIQCLFLGVVGEYLSQINIETKGRPHWVVGETAGLLTRDSITN